MGVVVLQQPMVALVQLQVGSSAALDDGLVILEQIEGVVKWHSQAS